MGFLPLAFFPEKANHKQKENIGVMSWALTTASENTLLAAPMAVVAPFLAQLCDGVGSSCAATGAVWDFGVQPRTRQPLSPSDRAGSGGKGGSSCLTPAQGRAGFVLSIQQPLLAERSQDVAMQCKHHPSAGLAVHPVSP